MTDYGAILSDLQILERLVADDPNCVFVSPLVDPAIQLGPSSLDLHLAPQLIVTRAFAGTHIDLAETHNLTRDISRYHERWEMKASEPFTLQPGEFALASTLEFIRLPSDIAGRLEGRSSLGRLGLQVHATAGFVDPGYDGVLTFELINSGKMPVKLKPGIRLGQMCFFSVREVQVPYGKKKNSKYGGSLGTGFTKIDQDSEIRPRE